MSGKVGHAVSTSGTLARGSVYCCCCSHIWITLLIFLFFTFNMVFKHKSLSTPALNCSGKHVSVNGSLSVHVQNGSWLVQGVSEAEMDSSPPVTMDYMRFSQKMDVCKKIFENLHPFLFFHASKNVSQTIGGPPMGYIVMSYIHAVLVPSSFHNMIEWNEIACQPCIGSKAFFIYTDSCVCGFPWIDRLPSSSSYVHTNAPPSV